MPVRLDRSSTDFAQQFERFLATKREVSVDIERATRAIVDDVAARGDIALIEATRKFDRLDLDAARLRVSAADVEPPSATATGDGLTAVLGVAKLGERLVLLLDLDAALGGPPIGTHQPQLEAPVA